MTPQRLVGMVSVVLALAIGASTGAFQLGGLGGSSSDGKRSGMLANIDQAAFTGADASLAAYRAGTGTFVGAPALPGMTIVRADTASYCLQAQQGTVVEHELGPGGAVQPGPC
jgi:hypothetical protein